MPEISIYKSNPIVQIIAGANTGLSGVTSASNLGVGTGIFSSKVGNDLQFKSLIAGTNIGISSDATSITINNTAPVFVITDGSGTTAAGTAVDIGGVLTHSATFTGAFPFSFQNTATSSTIAITPNVAYSAGGFALGIAPTAAVASAGSATSHLIFGNTTTFGGAGTKHNLIQVTNTVNNNSQAGTTLTGILYNPTLNNTTGLTHYAALFNKGTVGIGTLTPTALLQLAAGTATAGTAPLKLTTGTALGTPEDGAFEYHTSHLYFTIGSTRYQLDQQVTPAWLLASGGTLTGANTITGTTSNTIQFKFDTLGLTQTDGAGLWLRNSAPATVGAQQVSPSLVLEGQGWKTTATAGSQSVKWATYILPVQDTTNPTSTWKLATNVNGAGYSDVLTVSPWGVSTGVTGTVLLIAGAGTDHRISFNTPSNTHMIRSDSSAGRFALQAQAGYLAISIGGVDKLRVHDGSASGVKLGDVSIGSSTDKARLFVLQDPLTATWNPILRYEPGAHTSLTASTEFPDFVYGGASGDANTAVSTRTATWLAGTVSIQRSMYVKGTVLTGASATAIFTDAYSLYIDPPTVGTNATVTRAWGVGTSGNIISTGGTNSKIVLGAGGVERGMRLSAAGVLQLGAVGSAGGSGTGPIDLLDNNGAVVYASFNPNTNGVSSFAFGTSTLTNAAVYIVHAAQSSAWKPTLRLDPSAYTSLTAATTFTSYDFQGTTQTWLAGSVGNQYSTYFRGFTVAGASATASFTNVYTIFIDPPIQGTNASVSNLWALGLAGSALITQTTGAPALRLVNTSNGGSSAVLNAQAVFSSTMNFGGTGLVVTGGSGAAIGNVPILNLVGGVLSAQTASTELTDAVFDFSRTVTWATGAITTQRSMWIKGPTIAFATGSTVTNAYSLYIDPPVQGTNATLTGNYAIGLNGKARFITVPTNDNAATDLLVRDSTTGEVKYRTVASIASASILTADVTLNQTQILSLNSSPVQLVAAPGAGKFIQIIGPVICKYVFNSAAFATNTLLRIQHGTNVTSNLLGSVIDQVVNAYGNFGSVQWAGPASGVENVAVNIGISTGNPTGGGASSTLRVTFQYIIVTL